MKRLDSLEASYRCCWWGFWLFIAMIVMMYLCSCTTTRVVTVPEIHERHHWHTDSVKQTDTIINNQTTVIREVDSATMAQYGIRLDKAQRAWLIQNDRLQREIERLQAISTDRDTVRDSIPVPVPVEVVKEVPRQKSWFERTMFSVGIIALMALALFLAMKIKKYLP